MNIMDKLFKIAVAELGQKEIGGGGNNPAIVNYACEAGFSYDGSRVYCLGGNQNNRGYVAVSRHYPLPSPPIPVRPRWLDPAGRISNRSSG